MEEQLKDLRSIVTGQACKVVAAYPQGKEDSIARISFTFNLKSPY
jgi:hypothetical protein